MKKLVFLLMTFLIITSCKNKDSEQTKSILEKTCYEYSKNGDSINLQILENRDDVTADLNISYAEKDSNKGKFKGTLNGNKLIGTYTFFSEGVESRREVAFLIKENQIVEGFGEMTADGSTFKDTSKISYSSTMPLVKVACE